MSLLLSGRVTRVLTRDVALPSGETFVEHTYVTEILGDTVFVTRARNFVGAQPVEGETVELLVYVRAYVNKSGEANYRLHTTGRASAAASHAA